MYMSKRCTHIDSSGKECSYINAEGNSYCVKCGSLLDGKERKVVVKADYERSERMLNSMTDENKKLLRQVELQDEQIQRMRRGGIAPSGFRLVNETEYTSNRKQKEIAEEQKRTLEENVRKQQKIIDSLTVDNKSLHNQISQFESQIQKMKKDGYAPSGYHLEKDKSVYDTFWESLSQPNANKKLSDLEARLNKTLEENKRLKRRANMEWYEKLWEDYNVFIVSFVCIAVLLGIFWGIFSFFRSGVKEDDTLKIEQRDGHWGITKGSSVILPFEYDSIVRDKYDTIYSRIYKDGMVGLVNNQSGNTLIHCGYKVIGQNDNYSLGGPLIGVQKPNGKWCFLNHKGEQFGSEYDYARWLTGSELGSVGIRDNRGLMRYGYADNRGFAKIPCQYVEAYTFRDSLAIVRQTNSSPLICIDINGNRQFTLKYRTHNGFSESLMAVSNDYQWNKNTRFGFIDRKGNLVIDMFFTPYLSKDGSFSYPRFYKGRSYVRYNGRNGYIDKTGKFTEEK